MRSIMDKLSGSSASVSLILLIIVYISAYLIGCICGLSVSDVKGSGFTVFPSGIFSGFAGYRDLFSGFLFEFLFVFLIVFLFGLTYLGTIIIPGAVASEGLIQGITHAVYLRQCGFGIFFRSGITYMPAAALSLTVLLLFSAKSCGVSQALYRQLRGKSSAEIALKPYFFRFIVSLTAFTGAAVLRCILGLLETTLF